MILTDHELTAASGAIAALAIVGGYLGVRSANQNALKIAREERSDAPVAAVHTSSTTENVFAGIVTKLQIAMAGDLAQAID